MKKNALSIMEGILKRPGDELSARITDTGRQVLKVKTNGGKSKYSQTRYPNGTTVETKTTKQ
ncbi:hypothetical protein AALD74_20000 [Lachnospiraceae bacterium 48-21]